MPDDGKVIQRQPLTDEYLKALGVYDEIRALAPPASGTTPPEPPRRAASDLDASTDPASVDEVQWENGGWHTVLYNFEDRHGNTFQLSLTDIKRMLTDDPNDGHPPRGLWAQDYEALKAKEAAQWQLNEEGF